MNPATLEKAKKKLAELEQARAGNAGANMRGAPGHAGAVTPHTSAKPGTARSKRGAAKAGR